MELQDTPMTIEEETIKTKRLYPHLGHNTTTPSAPLNIYQEPDEPRNNNKRANDFRLHKINEMKSRRL